MLPKSWRFTVSIENICHVMFVVSDCELLWSSTLFTIYIARSDFVNYAYLRTFHLSGQIKWTIIIFSTVFLSYVLALCYPLSRLTESCTRVQAWTLQYVSLRYKRNFNFPRNIIIIYVVLVKDFQSPSVQRPSSIAGASGMLSASLKYVCFFFSLSITHPATPRSMIINLIYMFLDYLAL